MILLPIIFFRIYDRSVLLSIVYAQVLMAIVFSKEAVSNNIQDFLAMIQVLKLDFGFVASLLQLEKPLFCSSNHSERLSEVMLY